MRNRGSNEDESPFLPPPMIDGDEVPLFATASSPPRRDRSTGSDPDVFDLPPPLGDDGHATDEADTTDPANSAPAGEGDRTGLDATALDAQAGPSATPSRVMVAIDRKVALRSPKDLREHPLSTLIPDMTSEEYENLRDDVRAHGILDAIQILADGTIIDGRHRYRVALELGQSSVPCVVVHLKPGEDPVDRMIRSAVLRRHLSVAQRAMIALGLKEYHEAKVAAEARRTSGRASSSRAPSEEKGDLRANAPEGQVARPREVAARAVDVSPRTIQDAARVAAEAPDLIPAMKAGKTTVHAALQEAKQRKAASGASRSATRPKPPSATKLLATLDGSLSAFINALDAATARRVDVVAETKKSERKRLAQRLEDAVPRQRALAKALAADGGR
ncbi:MAG: ParB N-terminal domain-containing protein [Deltaproteobacteria bacterium]|nr:ParB N-terminal domain-containing protein [Deltaproteobacteria bacterium]